MKKLVAFLLLLPVVSVMPWACSSNNNPTTPIDTPTPTFTATIWAQYSPTNTFTGTATSSATPTSTGTLPPTATPTDSPTVTPTATPTNSPVPTTTNTPFPQSSPAYKTSGPATIQYPNGIAYGASKYFVAQGNGLTAGQVLFLDASLNVTGGVSSFGATAFGVPNGVAVNAAGTTFYGSGGAVTSWSSAGGAFSNPEGIAVDTNGNIYIADTGNDRVVELAPSGSVSNVWTTGASSFSEPSALALDGSNNLYVADASNQLVQVYNGSTWSSWSTNVTGLNLPGGSDVFGIATDGTNVYVADVASGKVLEFTVGGTFVTAIDRTSPGLEDPDGIVLHGGDVYVTDYSGPSGKGSLQVFGP
jgi:hypothetical protein